MKASNSYTIDAILSRSTCISVANYNLIVITCACKMWFYEKDLQFKYPKFILFFLIFWVAYFLIWSDCFCNVEIYFVNIFCYGFAATSRPAVSSLGMSPLLGPSRSRSRFYRPVQVMALVQTIYHRGSGWTGCGRRLLHSDVVAVEGPGMDSCRWLWFSLCNIEANII